MPDNANQEVFVMRRNRYRREAHHCCGRCHRMGPRLAARLVPAGRARGVASQAAKRISVNGLSSQSRVSESAAALRGCPAQDDATVHS
jgi:hypothetical protein